MPVCLMRSNCYSLIYSALFATHNKPLCFPKQVMEDFGAPLNKLSIWRMKSRKKNNIQVNWMQEVHKKTHYQHVSSEIQILKFLWIHCHLCLELWMQAWWKKNWLQKQTWPELEIGLLFWGFNPWRESGIVTGTGPKWAFFFGY